MKRTLLSLTILACAAAAQAGVVFSDDFNSYTDGPLIPQSTWLPNSGSGTIDVTNGELIVTYARGQDTYHELSGQPYMTNGPVTALYSSYTLRCIGLPTVSGTYFSHFGGSNEFTTSYPSLTGHRARLWASITNTAAGTIDESGTTFCLYLVNSVGSTTNGNNQWLTPLATNQTYTIVTRYIVETGASTLWVDPVSESDAGVSDPNIVPPDDPPRNGPINITGYCFRQASGEGTMIIDNLKVGTRFADVAGANTAPLISAIANQSAPMNAPVGPLAFTVQDAETPATGLDVAATSSNPALVPNLPANLTLSGTDENRTLTVTPATGQQGSATITISVSDGVNTSSTSFLLTVGAPSIAPVPNQMAVTNTPVAPVAVSLSDAEGDNLTLSASSSNPVLLPSDNITFTGSGTSWKVNLTPVPGEIGLSTITLLVTDGFNTNSTSFSLTMRPVVGVVFTENFIYSNFVAGVGNALIDATEPPTQWIHVSPTGSGNDQVMVTNVFGTNGFAYLSYTNQEDVGAPLTATFDGANGFVFYTSFSVNFSAPPSSSGGYFLHLKSSQTDTLNFRCKVFAFTNNAGPDAFCLGIANMQNSPVQFPVDLSLNQEYTVVTRYNAATGESVLWVDPLTEQSPSAVATDQPGISTIGGIGLREDSGIGNLAIGPIKIGTSFSDVVATSPAPTPEALQFQVLGSDLVLSWNQAAFSLASSQDVTGAYAKITGATSPYTNSITGTRFFRLVYP